MNVQTSCPQSGYWKELLHGNLPENLQAEMTAHLDGCESCQRAVEEMAANTPLGPQAVRQLAHPKSPPDPALQMAMNELKAKAGCTQTHVDSGLDGEIPLDFLDPPEAEGQLGKLGHYQVTEVIGRGGAGVVLKAFDTELHRVVAIKVLAPQLATSATARKRFKREAQAAAAVSHEHVVAIHAVEEAKGLPYLVMEYVAGQSLQDRIDRTGPLQPNEILRVGRQIASGLAAAHAQGLIHRDIKPANILLENGVERVKITDFGLARAVDDASLTQSGVVAGTPQYMAPEQARGEPLDCRADLFSLGSVLYTMCTGRPPFRAPTTMAVIRRVSEETPRPIQEINPDIPDWLVAIIDKLHAKNPADRFQSATDVAELLEQHLAHLQQPAVVPMPPRVIVRVAAPRKRSQALVWVLVAVGPVLLLGLCMVPIAGLFLNLGWTVVSADSQAPVAQAVEFGVVPQGEEMQVVEGGNAVNVIRQARLTLRGNPCPTPTVAFSPDKKTLATGDEQGFIFLWDARTGQKRAFFRAHDNLIWSLTFSRDGKRLASASWDMTVKVWEPERPGEAPVVLRGHTVKVWSVAFSPDGKRLASASEDRTVRIWDPATGQHWRTFQVQDHAYGVAYALTGNLFAHGASDGKIELWDPTDWKPLGNLEGHTYGVRLEFSPDGTMLASGGHDRAVILWDVAKKKKLAVLRGFKQMIESVAFSPDGKLLATGGGDWKNWSEPGEVTLWDVNKRRKVAQFEGHTSCVHNVAFSPDGKTLASASHDHTVKLWDESNWKLVEEAARDAKGWVPLFNGKDLTGWKTHPNQPGNWRVENRILTGSGDFSYLFSERGDFENFHLRVEAKIGDGGKSGVHFRARFGANIPDGYEAMINGEEAELYKTGSLFTHPGSKQKWNLHHVEKEVVFPDTWFSQEVIAIGNHLVIKVNGKTLVDVKDDSHRKGHFALQTLHRRTTVHFRKIEIKELPVNKDQP